VLLPSVAQKHIREKAAHAKLWPRFAAMCGAQAPPYASVLCPSPFFAWPTPTLSLLGELFLLAVFLNLMLPSIPCSFLVKLVGKRTPSRLPHPRHTAYRGVPPPLSVAD